MNASLERTRVSDGAHNSKSQVKVVRLNNFVGGSAASNNTTKSNKPSRAVASSHSPSGLGAGSGSDRIPSSKIKKSLKVA